MLMFKVIVASNVGVGSKWLFPHNHLLGAPVCGSKHELVNYSSSYASFDGKDPMHLSFECSNLKRQTAAFSLLEE